MINAKTIILFCFYFGRKVLNLLGRFKINIFLFCLIFVLSIFPAIAFNKQSYFARVISVEAKRDQPITYWIGGSKDRTLSSSMQPAHLYNTSQALHIPSGNSSAMAELRDNCERQNRDGILCKNIRYLTVKLAGHENYETAYFYPCQATVGKVAVNFVRWLDYLNSSFGNECTRGFEVGRPDRILGAKRNLKQQGQPFYPGRETELLGDEPQMFDPGTAVTFRPYQGSQASADVVGDNEKVILTAESNDLNVISGADPEGMRLREGEKYVYYGGSRKEIVPAPPPQPPPQPPSPSQTPTNRGFVKPPPPEPPITYWNLKHFAVVSENGQCREDFMQSEASVAEQLGRVSGEEYWFSLGELLAAQVSGTMDNSQVNLTIQGKGMTYNLDGSRSGSDEYIGKVKINTSDRSCDQISGEFKLKQTQSS